MKTLVFSENRVNKRGVRRCAVVVVVGTYRTNIFLSLQTLWPRSPFPHLKLSHSKRVIVPGENTGTAPGFNIQLPPTSVGSVTSSDSVSTTHTGMVFGTGQSSDGVPRTMSSRHIEHSPESRDKTSSTERSNSQQEAQSSSSQLMSHGGAVLQQNT
ncbi:unnamed protein product [Leuciscus chuanchicus]